MGSVNESYLRASFVSWWLSGYKAFFSITRPGGALAKRRGSVAKFGLGILLDMVTGKA